MKLRIISDTHTEFYQYSNFTLPRMEDEQEQILILAGDFCKFDNLSFKGKSYEILKEWSYRFKYILYVPGNHEYYNFNLKHTLNLKEKDFRKLILNDLKKNVIILNDKSVVIDDVCFIGSTLWTDYDKNNPFSMLNCKRGINDYNYIFWDGHKTVNPEHLLNLHINSLNFIKSESQKFNNKKRVIITHHMPTFQAVNERYRGSSINSAFASDLDSFIEEVNSDYWIFGHTHTSWEGQIGNTKLVCNPSGYPHNYGTDLENLNFNPNLVIEI